MKYILPIFATLFLLCSCSEKEDGGDFDNWHERNQHYVDSIASLAIQGIDGWERVLAFNLDEDIEALAPNNNHYVYIKKLKKSTGTYKPLFNDYVRVHYMGRLIPTSDYPQGCVFDRSYAGYTLNEQTDVPTLFCVKSSVDEGVVNGFCTALMHMVEGDSCQIVIPSEIGYADAAKGSIQPYSTLRFDIKLARIYRYQIDTDTSWH